MGTTETTRMRLHPTPEGAQAVDWESIASEYWGEVRRLSAALKQIAEMEPGSRGAYTKFAKAVYIATRALDGPR